MKRNGILLIGMPEASNLFFESRNFPRAVATSFCEAEHQRLRPKACYRLTGGVRSRRSQRCSGCSAARRPSATYCTNADSKAAWNKVVPEHALVRAQLSLGRVFPRW